MYFEVRSLSIFSFKNLAKLKGLSLAERNWAGALFVCLLMSVLVSEFSLRQFWRSRQERSFRTVAVEHLEKEQPELIFVGSSHIYAGVNPGRFSVSTVNLAESGLNYQMAEVLCRKYWNRLSEAKLVIIELDGVPVFKDTLGLSKGDFRRFYSWKLTGAELPLDRWQRFKVTLGEQLSTIRFGKTWPTIFCPEPIDENEIGPGFHGRKSGKLSRKDREAFFLAMETEFKDPVIEQNLLSLKRLLSDLNEAGVPWLGVSPPFHKDYWKHSLSKKHSVYMERAKEIFIELSPLNEKCLIDFSRFQEDRDKCFSDWTHLSLTGANGFSDQLSNHPMVKNLLRR